jgi:uncharacterized protein (TIGR03437 family)
LNTLIFAGVLAAFSGAQIAPAQTAVAHLAVQSGNGQVLCQLPTCTLQGWQPISVKATDVNGNPILGATVSWTVTGGSIMVSSATSVTNGAGIATVSLSEQILQTLASPGTSYLVNTIQATANNNSVVFTETQSLINETSAVTEIQAQPPTFGGTNLSEAINQTPLSANVGTTLSTPIIVDVAGQDIASNGVANVSVRILNEQSSPTLSCAPQGGYADPGTVLTNAQGIATCYPVFSGSGSGTFYILIGGVAGTDISTALYLEVYPGANQPGYAFTSIPGAPVAVQIVSGNNQVTAISQTLQPLVAKLVDVNGNAVQGAQMVWSVVPYGAAALTTLNAVTDNNGEVSQTISLDNLASQGAVITVALQSNTNISATFHEYVQGASPVTNMNKVSGDVQSAQEGASFANPLVVQVFNAAGPMANYPVQFSVSGPISISSTTAVTNSNGDASVTVTAGSISGTATVTATAGAFTQTFTLTITAVSTVVPNGISIVSGNSQSAILGATFAQPLVVQVNSTAGPVANYRVNFSTTGPISLTTSSELTNSSGQASITVAAGLLAGAGTVTASISGYSVTFNLTITAAGPTLSVSSFLNAASLLNATQNSNTPVLSPCSLAIISAPGLTPDSGIADLTGGPIFGRIPKTVNALTVTFGGIPAPILRVAQGVSNPQVTVQVPCEVTPGNSVPVVVNVNGGGTATINIPIAVVSPGILQQVMSDGVLRAVAVRSDGSFADIGGTDVYDPTNPIRLNEYVRFYLTGLGGTTPAIGTDDIQNPNADLANVDAVVAGTVIAGIVNGPTLQVISARAAPDLVGVYEVQVSIPGNAPIGNNVGIYIGIIPAGATATVYASNVVVPIGQ